MGKLEGEAPVIQPWRNLELDRHRRSNRFSDVVMFLMLRDRKYKEKLITAYGNPRNVFMKMFFEEDNSPIKLFTATVETWIYMNSTSLDIYLDDLCFLMDIVKVMKLGAIDHNTRDFVYDEVIRFQSVKSQFVATNLSVQEVFNMMWNFTSRDGLFPKLMVLRVVHDEDIQTE